MIVLRSLRAVAMTAAVGLAALAPLASAAASGPYAQMAPVAQYLIPNRQKEIDLARSAAPAAISLHATVLVLTSHGYETAVRGTDGFTCLVERSWTSPFDSRDFWNWKLRGPICYNAAAARSVLQDSLLRTQWALGGVSEAQMLPRVRAAFVSRQLPSAAPGSMAYMMSKQQYLGDAGKAWYPHVMLYAPKADEVNSGASWGANRAGSPIAFDSSHRVVPEPWALFYIPVGEWSDGSRAPAS